MTNQSWKEDFRKNFITRIDGKDEKYIGELFDEIESFISSTLEEQKSKILEEIKNLPRYLVQRHVTDPTIIGAVALEDLSTKIQNEV